MRLAITHVSGISHQSWPILTEDCSKTWSIWKDKLPWWLGAGMLMTSMWTKMMGSSGYMRLHRQWDTLKPQGLAKLYCQCCLWHHCNRCESMPCSWADMARPSRRAPWIWYWSIHPNFMETWSSRRTWEREPNEGTKRQLQTNKERVSWWSSWLLLRLLGWRKRSWWQGRPKCEYQRWPR